METAARHNKAGVSIWYNHLELHSLSCMISVARMPWIRTGPTQGCHDIVGPQHWFLTARTLTEEQAKHTQIAWYLFFDSQTNCYYSCYGSIKWHEKHGVLNYHRLIYSSVMVFAVSLFLTVWPRVCMVVCATYCSNSWSGSLKRFPTCYNWIQQSRAGVVSFRASLWGW